MEIYNETLMYTVAVMAALTYPSQCLPDDLLEAKIKVISILIRDSGFSPMAKVHCTSANAPYGILPIGESTVNFRQYFSCNFANCIVN